MTKADKLFEALFPRASEAFDVRLNAAALWKEQVDGGTIDRLWRAALIADYLLVRATSYREKFDLFTRPKFWADLYSFSALIGGDTGMARKGQRDQNDRALWKGFLDFRLSEGQLAECDAWKPKPTEIWETIDRLMADDFRLTLSYNKKTKLASVTLIDDSPTRKSGGFALSTSDENGALALKAALYKHTILLNGDWTSLLDIPPKARRG